MFGVDYDQTYASVAKAQSWKILLALAATLNLEIEQIDVITAFLQGKADEDICIELPDGYCKKNDDVGLLLKALYGLKQSPRLWQQTLSYSGHFWHLHE